MDQRRDGRNNLPPTLTGHEGTTFIVSTALNVAGPPLGRFIEKAMADLASREPGRVADWREWRASQAARHDGRLSPDDTRRLMLELRYHWTALSRYFDDSPRRDDWADGLRRALTDQDVPSGRRLFPTINAAQHQEAAITPRAAHGALVALWRTMMLIGAQAEANYLAPLITRLRTQVRAAGRSAKAPKVNRPPSGTTCVGAHWVQPKMGIPGHWWWVAIRDDQIERIDVDLTTPQVTEGLIKTQGPALAGLAFCFAAPADYVRRADIGSVDALWQRSTPFSHRNAKEAVQGMGEPFRLVGYGQTMRSPKEDPTAFRETEVVAWKRTGARPSSIFDIDGTDSVGALALNGMPIIRDARRLGAAIWPFDRPATSGLTCLEIFPRALWASLNPREDPTSKKNRARRQAFIEQCRDEGLSVNQRDAKTLAEEERAFDAFVTARALSAHGGGLNTIEALSLAYLEGQIWLPE